MTLETGIKFTTNLIVMVDQRKGIEQNKVAENKNEMPALENVSMENATYLQNLNNTDLEKKILQKLIDAQNEFNIQSTPSFLINGNLVEGNKSIKEFRQIINKILSE